jgi:hypothetical protein
MPRPQKNRERRTIEMNLEIWNQAEKKRLEFQGKEGRDIQKIDWINRLLEFALKNIKPQ